MIEKLDHADIVMRENLVSKINELVEAHNQLAELFGNHYHNTSYRVVTGSGAISTVSTTGPKQVPTDL